MGGYGSQWCRNTGGKLGKKEIKDRQSSGEAERQRETKREEELSGDL